MDKQVLHATIQMGFTNEVLGEKSRHKSYYSIYKTFKTGQRWREAIYVLEVVYPGGELIYHQTNSTLNS